MNGVDTNHPRGAAVTAFGAGVLFAIGLAIAGMTTPANVIGFLDVFGQWNPTLMLVMAAAIAVHAPMYWRYARKRTAPVFANHFAIPDRRDIDARLLGGAAIFGAGWGIAGFCPGPAIASLATGDTNVWWFVAAMMVGMAGYHVLEAVRGTRRLPLAP